MTFNRILDILAYMTRKNAGKKAATEMLIALAPRVKRLKRYGLMQEDVADKIGITQAALSNILAGKKSPYLATYLAIIKTIEFYENKFEIPK